MDGDEALTLEQIEQFGHEFRNWSPHLDMRNKEHLAKIEKMGRLYDEDPSQKTCVLCGEGIYRKRENDTPSLYVSRSRTWETCKKRCMDVVLK